LELRKVDAPNYGTPELRTFRTLTGLALMLRIIGLGLGKIGVRVLQEVSLRLLATEAVGLAFEAAVDRAILCRARPSAHMLSNSPVTANAAVARPMLNAPASAVIMIVLVMANLLGGTGGFFPHARMGRRPSSDWVPALR
jgi:hypothetical protein